MIKKNTNKSTDFNTTPNNNKNRVISTHFSISITLNYQAFMFCGVGAEGENEFMGGGSYHERVNILCIFLGGKTSKLHKINRIGLATKSQCEISNFYRFVSILSGVYDKDVFFFCWNYLKIGFDPCLYCNFLRIRLTRHFFFFVYTYKQRVSL